MKHGKSICNQLEAVRRSIAEENSIPLEIEECTYKGECRGTCPKCEAEVRFLENALAEKLRLGKVATVAGLALGLAATATQAQAQTPVDTIGKQQDNNIQQVGIIKGVVTDLKTHEPLPLVSVVVFKDSVQYAATVTDFDGKYKIQVPPGRGYDIKLMNYGYYTYVRTGIQVLPTGFTVVEMELRPSGMPEEEVIIGMMPVIQVGGIDPHSSIYGPYDARYYFDRDINPGNPPSQGMLIDGVKVIVR